MSLLVREARAIPGKSKGAEGDISFLKGTYWVLMHICVLARPSDLYLYVDRDQIEMSQVSQSESKQVQIS